MVARVTNLENMMDVEKLDGGLSALTDVLGLLADDFECHSLSRSIDDCEAAGRAMRAAKDTIERLVAAIETTLDENGHLADGENCTLIALKRAIGMRQPPISDDSFARIVDRYERAGDHENAEIIRRQWAAVTPNDALISALVAAVELIETISPIEGDTVRHARSAIAKAVGHNAGGKRHE